MRDVTIMMAMMAVRMDSSDSVMVAVMMLAMGEVMLMIAMAR